MLKVGCYNNNVQMIFICALWNVVAMHSLELVSYLRAMHQRQMYQTCKALLTCLTEIIICLKILEFFKRIV